MGTHRPSVGALRGAARSTGAESRRRQPALADCQGTERPLLLQKNERSMGCKQSARGCCLSQVGEAGLELALSCGATIQHRAELIGGSCAGERAGRGKSGERWAGAGSCSSWLSAGLALPWLEPWGGSHPSAAHAACISLHLWRAGRVVGPVGIY